VSYDQAKQAARRALTRHHTIEDVRFQETRDAGRPMDEAPIRCSCGADTTSGTWDSHRGLTWDAARKAARAEAA
jgi:hypothetical protein